MRHLDVASVARVSIVFYMLVLAVVATSSVLLWYVADVSGSVGSIERSVRTLFDLKSFRLRVSAIALYTSAGGLVLAAAGTAANVLAAVMYNLIHDLVGGLRLDLEVSAPPGSGSTGLGPAPPQEPARQLGGT